MPEITNRKSFEAWLETRPREDAVLVAARAALRVLPLLGRSLDRDAEKRRATVVLPACRAMAVASLAGKWPSLATEVRGAAYAAYGDAANSARAAAAAAAYAAAARAAAFAAGTAFAAAAARDGAAGAAATNAAAAAADAAAADAAAVAVAVAARAAANPAAAAAAADPAVSAAARTAHAAAAAAANDFWTAVGLDAAAPEEGTDRRAFDRLPLWHGPPPSWAAAAWQSLSRHLLDAAEGWEVWTDWYDALLHGRPQDPELEVAKALIPDETWKQGSSVVNAEIVRLIAEYELPAGYAADRQNLADLALRSSQIRAALTDFTYDQLANLMRSVAFADDLKQLDDPEEVRRRHDRLADLAQDADELLEDLQASPANMPAVENALRRYRDEALKPIEIARHRRLWFNYGAALNRTVLDDYAMSTLGEPLAGNLRDMVQRHLDLFRDYLAVVAGRTAVLDEILPRPGATLRDAVEVMDAVLEEIGAPDVGPPADEDTQGAFRMDRDQLRDMLHAAEMAHVAAQREKHEADAWLRVKLFAVTALRLKIRALQAAGHAAWNGVSAAATASSALAGLERYFPDSHRRLIELFVNLLPK